MPTDSSLPVQTSRGLTRFAWCVVFYNVLVVVWGALVRATGSGGGCGSHWPLCNGYVNPLHHPRLATIIEFSHRQSTTVATVLIVTLAVWTFRKTASGARARKASLWTIFFLVVEALLGALLVLRHWVENNDSTGRVIAQAVHFTNTLLLLATLTLTAWFLGPEAERRGSIYSRTQPYRSVSLAAILAIVSTILAGASGALAALADTLFPSPSLSAAFAQDFAANAPVLIRMRWIHPAAAVVAFSSVVWMIRLAGLSNRLGRLVLTLLGVQFGLGILDVVLLAPIWMQLLHVLVADLYWIALAAFAAESLWGETSAPARLHRQLLVRK